MLKNGKQMVINGSYEVQGQFVVITEPNGELKQLPIKMVDLEKSQAATRADQERLAELEKGRDRPAPKKAQKNATMAEIADYVEKNRATDNPPKANITIGNERLEQFSDDNPRPTNTEAEFVPPTTNELSSENLLANRDKYGEQYKAKEDEIRQLQLRIDELKSRADYLQSISTSGDDISGGAFDELERTDKEIVDMGKKKEAMQKELVQIQKEAKAAGIPGVDRYKVKKDGDGNN